MMSTLAALSLTFIYVPKETLAKQRVIAIGQVLCNGKPYDGAIVKLYDKDVLIDSLMAKNQTLKDGSFYLDGTATDVLSKIDPELYIYHKCNKGSLPVHVVRTRPFLLSPGRDGHTYPDTPVPARKPFNKSNNERTFPGGAVCSSYHSGRCQCRSDHFASGAGCTKHLGISEPIERFRISGVPSQPSMTHQYYITKIRYCYMQDENAVREASFDCTNDLQKGCCIRGSESCKREWIFSIPKDYVYDDKDKKVRPVDVGRWELAITPKSETFKCLPAKKMAAAA